MDVICTDWFIYNITEHINTTDLSRLKFINKYYYKQITKQYILNTIDKNISKSTNIKQIGYVLRLDPDSNPYYFTNNDDNNQYITIPRNTLYLFTMQITSKNVPYVSFAFGKIRNVLGEIDIYELKILDCNCPFLEFQKINNVVKLMMYQPCDLLNIQWIASMSITSISF